MNNTTPTIPVIGMGATYCIGSDRYAGTIVYVSASGRSVFFQKDHAINIAPPEERCLGGSQEYRYEPNIHADVEVYTLRKNGRWIQKGCGLVGYGHLSLGKRNHYMDPSF